MPGAKQEDNQGKKTYFGTTVVRKTNGVQTKPTDNTGCKR